MKVAFSATGEGLEAGTSQVFGRCPVFVFVDTETNEYESIPNSAVSEGGGAGIKAAQSVVEKGAMVVVTGNLGPKAFSVLQAAGVESYSVSECTVKEALELYRKGDLQKLGSASTDSHFGIRKAVDK